MQRGYVKLWRKVRDSGLLQNGPALQLFTWLLTDATFKPSKRIVSGQPVFLEPGQAIFARRRAAQELALTERKCRTSLDMLVNMEIVTHKTTRTCTIISFVNWQTYQQEECTGDPHNDQQTTQRQECKKNKRQNTPPNPQGGSEAFNSFWQAYPRKVGKDAAAKAWAKRQGELPEVQILIATIERQKASQQWQNENGKYIPYPATWLTRKN